MRRIVLAKVFLAEKALQRQFVAFRDKVPVRLAGTRVIDLLSMEGLQKERLAHTDGGLLGALPLLADTLAEQEVTEREVQEDVLQQIVVREHYGGRRWCHPRWRVRWW
jgi:hypothetical protein